jgi:hypothetical protein
MRTIGILIAAALFGISVAVANDTAPPVGNLNVPSNGNPSLFPVDDSTLRSVLLRFDIDRKTEPIAVICCDGGWVPGFAVAINSTEDGGYTIIGFSHVMENQRDKRVEKIASSQAVIESELARRTIAVLRNELERVRPNTRDGRVMIDIDSYYYIIKLDTGKKLTGYIQEVPPDSRLGKVNALAGYLHSFACAKEDERTRLLGLIDLTVTEVELLGR